MGVRPFSIITVPVIIATIQSTQHGSQHRPFHLVRRLPLEPLQFQNVGIKAVRHDLLPELAAVEQGRHPLSFLSVLSRLFRDPLHHFVGRLRQVLPFILFHLFPQFLIACRPAGQRRAAKKQNTDSPQDSLSHKSITLR